MINIQQLVMGLCIFATAIGSLWFGRKALKLCESRFLAASGYMILAIILAICGLLMTILLIRGTI
jgi:hypothetical protein